MFCNVPVHPLVLMVFLTLLLNVLWALERVMQRLQLGSSNSSCSQNFVLFPSCEPELSITLCKGSFL